MTITWESIVYRLWGYADDIAVVIKAYYIIDAQRQQNQLVLRTRLRLEEHDYGKNGADTFDKEIYKS